MISVVCVYNDKATMDRILLPSLREQTAKYEIITINNISKAFTSAASALNYGAAQAHEKYIMFVHQDVELGSATWLEDIEQQLGSLSNFGIAGVIGMSADSKSSEHIRGFIAPERERLRGFICNAGMDEGQKLEAPIEVQTLDECVLIALRERFFSFDCVTFDGWHCYGADYCLTVQKKGFKVYALPAYVYHRSILTNNRSLLEYQRKLYWKHRKPIYTTAGSMTMPKALTTPVLSYLFRLYYHYRKDWISRVCNELTGCETILDIGCGYNSPLQHLRKDGRKHHLIGVDAYKPYLLESQKKLLHDSYIEADLRTVDYPDKSFDGVFCSEVLEHLTKIEGYIMLNKMSQWANKAVVITTPNGYVLQQDSTNPFQEHKSGWSIEELKQFGFTEVKGMSGLKCLRNSNAGVRFRPLYLWAALSVASQAVTEFLPSLAFQLLAIKRISG